MCFLFTPGCRYPYVWLIGFGNYPELGVNLAYTYINVGKI